MLLKKRKKREQKKAKRQMKDSVESIYMRDAIFALIHSQSTTNNPLKYKQASAFS